MHRAHAAVAVKGHAGEVRRRRPGEQRLLIARVLCRFLEAVDARGQPSRLQRRREVGGQELRLVGRRERRARPQRPGVRLVLQRDVVDRHPRRRVGLDELDEVLSQRGIELRHHLARRAKVPVEPVGLHPRRGRPRICIGDDLRVLGQHLLERWQDVGQVVTDREIGQRRVRLSRRQVVVGVRDAVRAEVRCAHRDPDEVQVDARLTEQRLHRDRVRRGGELLFEQVRGAVGHRGAESGDPLVADLPVDGDHLAARGRRRKPLPRPLAGQGVRQVGGGLGDGRGRRGACGRRRRAAWNARARA